MDSKIQNSSSQPHQTLAPPLSSKPLLIDLLTPFPEMPSSILDSSILKKAQTRGVVIIRIQNLRNWATDRHRTVDDTPYGGGPGMVMKIEPIHRALQDLRNPSSLVICPSPQGAQFNQQKATILARHPHLIFLCGHYEGIDQRVLDHLVDEEISIGDYVLTNGVLASLVIIDAIVRLLPGALGDELSASQDSFQNGLLDYPHYTRPANYNGWQVPSVLLSGNHAAIAAWRYQQALERTRHLRPDLLEKQSPSIPLQSVFHSTSNPPSSI
ncbi:MAG: tRNA (guanosine(37)-N1)-methyltransferase TrmD [Chthoniobacterales bacterium]|nr:tRNA (guanosine(37)-N1)-methyltransferase TrmD [Chthoniobacterales bacterium]